VTDQDADLHRSDPRVELARRAIQAIEDAVAALPAEEVEAIQSLADELGITGDDVAGFGFHGAQLGPGGPGDIPSLCFIALMSASQSSNEDLSTIMDGVRSINMQKDGLRGNRDVINRR